MNLYLDLTSIPSVKCGIREYALAIVPWIDKITELNDTFEEVFLLTTAEFDFEKLYLLKGVSFHNPDKSQKGRFILSQRVGLWLKKAKPGVYWTPNYMVPLTAKTSIKIISTIHDIKPLESKNYTGAFHRAFDIFLYKSTIAKSHSIITVSNTSRNKLRRYVGNKDIDVIACGPSRLPFVESIKSEKYGLFVGRASDGSKNVVQLINTFNLAHKQDSSIGKLVIVGGKNAREVLNLYLEYSNLDIREFVTEAELSSLYKNAHYFIHLGIGEGFGIPVLDALNAGANLILAESEIFREIVGENSVRFVNYKDTNSVAYAIICAATERRRGIQKSTKFDWKTSADNLATLLRRVACRES